MSYLGNDGRTSGDYYYRIVVPKSISKEGYIFISADIVEVKDGDLIATYDNSKEGEPPFQQPVLYLARGSWTAVLQANCLDGSTCRNIEHWLELTGDRPY